MAIVWRPEFSVAILNWIPSEEECYWVFREVYQFHPLAVEDAIKDVHVPKVDEYGTDDLIRITGCADVAR